MDIAPPTADACTRSRGILHLDREEFTRVVEAGGGRKSHARAIRTALLRTGAEHLHAHLVPGQHLPASLVRHLGAQGLTATGAALRHQVPSADGSRKLVLGLEDGAVIETVVMPGGRSGSVCVSSQVGCPVECPFCASGIGGLSRNLTTGEILDQVVWARRFGSFARVVVMGIGEPLLNWPAVGPALDALIHEMGWPAQRITVSTVGWPERLRALAEEGRGERLAVSLHASDTETRAGLVPAMAQVPVEEVIDAARCYWRRNGQRVQFEYVVLPGINDDLAHVDRLAALLHDMDAYVNLIPWNPVAGMPYGRPHPDHLYAMIRRARDQGLLATCRQSRGQDSAAACGQLRRQWRPAPGSS